MSIGSTIRVEPTIRELLQWADDVPSVSTLSDDESTQRMWLRQFREQGLIGWSAVQDAPWVPALAETVRLDRVRLDALHALRVQLLENLGSAGHRTGAQWAVVKGLAAAVEVFDRPAERPMADLDLLVAPDDRNWLENALRVQGFQQVDIASSTRETKWSRGPLYVEVQERLSDDPRFRFDTWELLSRRRPLRGLTGVDTLDDADALVWWAAHQALHAYRLPLVGWIEYRRRRRSLEAPPLWTVVDDRARATGTRPALRLADAVCAYWGWIPHESLAFPTTRHRWLAHRLLPLDGTPPSRWSRISGLWHALIRWQTAPDATARLMSLSQGLGRWWRLHGG